MVACRDRDRQAATLDRERCLGGLALCSQAHLVAGDRLEVADQPGLAQAQLADHGARALVCRETLPLGGRARTQLRTDRCGRLLRGLKVGHRPLGLGSLAIDPRRTCRRDPGGLVPADMRRGEQRRGQLLAGRQPCGLLLGLGGQTPRLRPKLGEDVLDPGEVRLRLGELLLRLAPAPLVSAHAGDLLEQWAALLGPERERLVDHPLADEQKRVVREMGTVEQVDQVAQADPLLVQEIVVLAAPIEPPAELEDAEIDRQQPVAVIEDERHVRHAERGPLLRAGEDHVLRLAAPQGTALLAEGPAERVGEVALAGAVWTHDRADAGAELHDRPLCERLEALHPEGQEAGGRTHRAASAGGSSSAAGGEDSEGIGRLPDLGARDESGRVVRSPASARRFSMARCAAAVSATRRDGPTPTPSGRPSTSTSIRKSFSWSGPVASTT